jgi:hypothetical protein
VIAGVAVGGLLAIVETGFLESAARCDLIVVIAHDFIK